MQPHDPKTRNVAGITCSGVMEVLSAYADGEVDRNVATQIEAHVAGCRWCEQFGGGFGQMLQTMRTRLAEADPLPTDVESRLRATLAQVR